MYGYIRERNRATLATIQRERAEKIIALETSARLLSDKAGLAKKRGLAKAYREAATLAWNEADALRGLSA